MEKQRFGNSKHKLRVRLGSVALVLIMLLSLLPATALAAPPTGLWVAGTQITGEGYWLNDNGGITATGASESNYNVKYDGSGTLTLKGASINRYHSFDVSSGTNSAAIYAAGDLNLVLEETSTVGGRAANGIYTTGSLTISGTGTANITIAAEDGCGIFASSSLTAQSGSVTAIATGPDSCGISAASVTVDGGTVRAQGNVLGVYSRSAVSVEAGNLTGEGSMGIFSMATLSVSGGTVAGVSEEAVDGGYSFGIYTLEALTITGGSVTSTGVEAGIAAVEGMTISGSSTVTATGTGTTGNSYGVASQGDVTITDTPNVTATGNTSGIQLTDGTQFIVGDTAYSLVGVKTVTVTGGVAQGLTPVDPVTPPADDGVNTEEELIAAIAKGGEITLTGNIDLTEALTISKTVTLDLNGHTLSYQQASANEAAVYIEGPSTVTINDSSGGNGGIQGNNNGYGILVKSDVSLVVNNGTFSGGAFYCIAIEWGASNVNVTLNGGTYDNGVSVSTISGGTFNSGICEVGTIIDGTFGDDTEAQAYYFVGGTFNGSAQCWSEIEGGTFNGNLTLGRNVTSVAKCSINKALEWAWGKEPPAFDDSVTFADGIKIYNDGYEIVDGKLQAIPKYTVIVDSADSAKGTVTVTGYQVRKPGAALNLDSTSLAGGGRKWENVYRDYTVKITKTTVTPKAGYTFVGWYDNPEGTGTPYSTAESLSYDAGEEGIQNNISFYAVFEDDASYEAKVDAAEKWLGVYESTSSYEIDSTGDMESFAVAVNYLEKNFSGKTVNLTASLTYGESDSFTPIGNSGIAFKGTFDGQDHTISGLSYSTTNQSSAYVGLFGNVNSATIQNLTLSGVNFSGGWMTGAFAGHADNTAFTNCKLTGNSSLADAYFLGGIFGHGAASNTVSGCTVENSTIDGYWKTGGVSGYICGATVTDTKIKDTTFPGTGFNGALIGHANDGKTEMTNVTVSGVTDGSQQKIHVVGTNYASGKDHTITITGGSTYVDAAGILQSALGDNNVAVSGGSYTFAIPVDQIDTGKVSVTFKNGEKIVIVQVIATGGTVTPPTMSDDGASIFDGWYLEDGVTRITSSTTFSANTVATPKWTELAITLSQSSLSIVQGGTATLTATVTPATAPDKTVTWSTSDSAIATIDNGTVIAVAPGTATITAAVDGKSASCTVTVTAAGMVIPAVEEPKTDTDQISDSADKQTASDVAKTVAADETITSAAQSAATELNNSSEKSDLIEKGNQDLNPSEGKEVTLYTQTYLQIEATELSKDEENSAITSITLNITPMMQVVASTATNSADIKLDSNGETNAVVVQDPKELEITTSAEITVKLPENFKSQTVYVKHQASNGGTYFYQAPADSTGKVTFTSAHGFSPFTFSLTNEAVAVVDGISYASFQEAVNAAADNDVVEVLKNESLTATVSGSSRTITVKNLTGNSITVTLNGQTMPIDNGATQEYTYTRPSGGGGVTTYAITVPSDVDGGAVKVSPTRASSGTTVTITVTPDDGYELAKLTVTDKDGDTVKLTDKGDGKYTFTMPASAVEVEASFQEIVVEPDNPFIDVYESDYYYEAVLWAVENGVTNGTTATTFSPNVTVTRAQMVTFLWRAYGSPEATGENPFTDVSESEYYYDAVLWAVENGITVGTTATTFSPEAPVTRAQAVTFQWRAAGSPAASGDSFNDVDANDYYADAVIWAVANGVTNGTGGNNFSPEVAVSRAQAVTFLYRELG